MTVRYSFADSNAFVIQGYDKAKTFASFLPGIAGLDGIPMWSFYVNRGQAMGSFGVRDKNGAIMEFFPANILCRHVERQGFRTFVRVDGAVHEIFSSTSADDVTRTMTVEANRIAVGEENRTLGLRVTASYFTLPHEDIAAIVRKVVIESMDGKAREFELLDGLPQILPYGVGNGDFQAMANLMRSWFDVFNTENLIPFYKVRASTADSVEVSEVNQGNFYLSFSTQSGGLIPPVYDMDVIFGANTALSAPDGWQGPADALHTRPQVPQNKVSGGFSGVTVRLEDSFTLYSVIGHADSPRRINAKAAAFTPEAMERAEARAVELVETLLADVATRTANPLFDRYVGQCHLDNLLRGGRPLIFDADGGKHVYHVYSRKHGDTEREYNFFSLEPAFYSQGNGNYRDVCQNRRNDVLLNPEVGSFNVRHFLSLIQADGYNPLQVKGCLFTLKPDALEGVLAQAPGLRAQLAKLLSGPYTPGQLMTLLHRAPDALAAPAEQLLQLALSQSEQTFEAEFGEGYWSDHWTYLMDLVDTYLTVYPDREEAFLFDEGCYRFFHSPVHVLPRADKYVLSGDRVRQIGALQEPHNHNELRKTAWLRTEAGKGDIYQTTLLAKLLNLALMKFANLDPEGMGVEMEGGRPGWNDALNGLPGVFGSGLGETAELLRLVNFLEAASRHGRQVALFAEAADLLAGVLPLARASLRGELNDFDYWDKVNALKEAYREAVRAGIGGQERTLSAVQLQDAAGIMAAKLRAGLAKAQALGDGVIPTFFTFEATAWQQTGRHNPVNGYPCVAVQGFRAQPLPAFLEGPARLLKTLGDPDEARSLYEGVKASDLYDKALGMYQTSVSLEATPHDIGRLRAFTAGWLERESIFLHMEYKFLYAMLKSGLHEPFFRDIRTALIPFLDPAVYGRSTLENSSFLASSANPDPANHGRGFVARLSGSTAEMLSMWFAMMAGHQPFAAQGGELTLTLRPILPAWLFDEAGEAGFRFLGHTEVIYRNTAKRDTFGADGVAPVRYTLWSKDGVRSLVQGASLSSALAQAVREGEYTRIVVDLE